ncbi:MAG: hypothetical protein AAF745_00165 [Planctomycetota bacterium]
MAIRIESITGPSVAGASFAAGLMRGQMRYGAQAGREANRALDRRDRRSAEAVRARERALDREARIGSEQLRERDRSFSRALRVYDINRRQEMERERLDYGRERDMLDLRQRQAERTPGLLGMSEEQVSGVPRGELSGYNRQMWTIESARNLDDQINQIRSSMTRRQLTPEGQQVWSELAGSLRAIEAQRDDLRPTQYSQAVNRWLNRFERSQISQYEAEPPTLAGEMAGRRMQVGPGMDAILQPDGKIQYLKSYGDTGTDDMMPSEPSGVAAIGSDDKKWTKAYQEAEKVLEDRYFQSLPDDADPSGEPPSFSPEQIAEEVKRQYAEQRQAAAKREAARRVLMGQPRQSDALPGQPPAPELDAGAINQELPLDQIPSGENATVDDLRQILSQTGESTADDALQELLGPQMVAEMERLGSKNPQQDLLNYWTQVFKPSPQPKQPTREELKQQRMEAIRSQPGYQRLEAVGKTPDDLAGAMRIMSTLKGKYPNAESLDEMATNDREKFLAAQSVLKAAQ